MPYRADYKEHHTDVSVKFVIKLAPEKMQEALAAGLHNKFKLAAKISTGTWKRLCKHDGGLLW